MAAIWAEFGFYFWALTTALVIIILAWLAWLTFGHQVEVVETPAADPEALVALTEQVTDLAEAAPLMQNTLGRALQYVGLVHYPDSNGAQAFALAVLNARGNGYVLTSSVRGGVSAKPLLSWATTQALSPEEQRAVEEARGQTEVGGKSA